MHYVKCLTFVQQLKAFTKIMVKSLLALHGIVQLLFNYSVVSEALTLNTQGC